jgi:hypothetical protein
VIRRRIPALALVLAASWPATALADGLYLKLKADKAQVPAATAVKVTLTAVALRSFALPATPVFLIDDGKGQRPCPEAECRAIQAVPAFVGPDAPLEGTWEVSLPAPGKYKIKAQYKLPDRTIQSNAVKVEVVGEGDTRATSR